MTVFYLGTHRPSWMTFMDVPLFLSASTIHRLQRERRRSRGHGCGRWAFDSAAFTANSPHTGANPAHPWHLPPDEYGGMVARVMEQMGVPPDFAAPQDWPCEEGVRAVTGHTVYTHQVFTLDNFLFLYAEFGFVPWVPVLQGWTPREYILHMEMYEQAGVHLADFGRVGLGSVCRRGSAKSIVHLVEEVQAYAVQRYGKRLPLHGFGMNIAALRQVAHLLASSDSLAWSDGARNDRIRLDGCEHKVCNNCPRYARLWFDKVRAAMDAPKQLTFDTAA